MKLNHINKIPDGLDYSFSKLDALHNYDLEELYKHNFDEAWYWYASASYEGSGQMIIRKGNLYDIHNLGHCSCYAATDHIKFNGRPLDELWDSLSEELKKESNDLFNAIKAPPLTIKDRMLTLVTDIASALNDKKGSSEDKLSLWETSLLLECESILTEIKEQ
jgi:hypothetical protein